MEHLKNISEVNTITDFIFEIWPLTVTLTWILEKC